MIPLRVGLIGAGMISACHLRAWRKLETAEVVTVVDPDQARARARAGEFDVPTWYGDAEIAIRREQLDAVDIASPRATHADLVRLAAGHGLAVLCQKPLTPTYREAHDLVRETRGRTRLMVHENWRFRPYYRQVAAWLAAGRLGAPHQARFTLFGSGLLPDPTGRVPALERQPFLAGEERLLIAETLIHHIDVARWLLGPLELLAATRVRTVAAVVGETAAAMLFRGRDDLPVVVEGNLAAAGFPPQPSDRLELIGSRASVTLLDSVLELRDDGRCERIAYKPAEAYQASFDGAIAHFVDRLADGRPFETDASDNLATLRLVEAAYH